MRCKVFKKKLYNALSGMESQSQLPLPCGSNLGVEPIVYEETDSFVKKINKFVKKSKIEVARYHYNSDFSECIVEYYE